MKIPSKLIEDCVNAFAQFPGIGRKTALRLTLYLLNQSEEEVAHFGEAVLKMRSEVRYCKQCFNVSDADVCSICTSPSRKQEVICVVESLRDIIAIENTNQYNGLYHVLGGVISPIDGIGPEQLNIAPLVARVEETKANEIIMALSPTMEGDTTIFYISKKLNHLKDLKLTTIARGVSFGGELEYTDELTLARSIATRLPYENYLIKKD